MSTVWQLFVKHNDGKTRTVDFSASVEVRVNKMYFFKINISKLIMIN